MASNLCQKTKTKNKNKHPKPQQQRENADSRVFSFQLQNFPRNIRRPVLIFTPLGLRLRVGTTGCAGAHSRGYALNFRVYNEVCAR